MQQRITHTGLRLNCEESRPGRYTPIGLLVILLVLINPLGAFEEWERTFGTPNVDDWGRCIQRTADGGYFVSGDGASYKMGVARLDSLGEVVWHLNHLPGDMEDIVNGGLAVLADQSCVLLAGLWRTGGPQVIYLLKLSPAGESLWARRYALGDKDFWPQDLRPTRDGGMIAVGEHRSSAPGDPNGAIVRFGSEGDTVWTQGVGQGDTVYDPYTVVQTRDGGFLVGGGLVGGQRYALAWLLKLDSLGNKEWFRTYGDREYGCECVALDTVTGGPGYVIAGARWSGLPGGWWLWLAQVTEVGDTIWTRTFEKEDSVTEYATGLCPAPDSGWLVVGCRGFGMGSGRGLFVRTDRQGYRLWTREFNNQNYVLLEDGLTTSEGGFVAVGVAPEPGNGANDFYVVRVRDSGLTAIAAPEGCPSHDGSTVQLHITRVCTEGSPEVEFYLPQSGLATLALFDLNGRRLAEPVSHRLDAGWHTAVPPADLTSGLYFIRLQTSAGTVTQKLVLTRH